MELFKNRLARFGVFNKWVGIVLLGCVTISLCCFFGLEKARSAAQGQLWVEKAPTDKALAGRVNMPNFVPIVEEVDKSVVNISTTTAPKARKKGSNKRQQFRSPFDFGPDRGPGPEEFFERFFGMPEEEGPRQSLGSGFIINKEGYILTNNHVVENADKIEVRLFSGKVRNDGDDQVLKARVIGRDPMTDVALIKIDAKVPLHPLPLGDSDKLAKGEWVLAIGNPLGLDHTVTAGIVSAKGREINMNQNRRFDNFIQTDAAIYFGNSGGPLINLNGEAVGISTAIAAVGSGIGFAVPITTAKKLLPELKEKGFALRGYLGILIKDVDPETAEAFKLPSTEGVLVQDVVEGGPAAKSDLKRGDVIREYDGKKVAHAKELQDLVAATQPGKSVDVVVTRDGKTKKMKVKAGKLPGAEGRVEAKGEGEGQDLLGIVVQDAEGKEGVEVVQVDADSPLMEKGLQPGIIITKITTKKAAAVIKGIADYKKAVKGLNVGDSVVLDVVTPQGQKFFIAFKVEKRDRE